MRTNRVRNTTNVKEDDSMRVLNQGECRRVGGGHNVCTPEDAYRCFMRTEMDYLVLENVLLSKQDQPAWKEEGDWRDEYELD